MAEVRDAVGIEGLSARTARNFRDKDRMKAVLRGAGVPVARSALARSAGELRAFVERVGLPVIVKPPAGLGTRATYRVEREADLAAVPAPTAQAPLQVEEFVRAIDDVEVLRAFFDNLLAVQKSHAIVKCYFVDSAQVFSSH